MTVHLTTLSEKAILVKLTVRRPTTVRRDAFAESRIQSDLQDNSLTVLSKLFRDKANPINRIMAAANEVYIYHRTNTLPWVDAGPRVVPTSAYFEYTAEMRQRIHKVESMVAELDDEVYTKCVQMDITSRGARATEEDYPTLERFKDSLGFDLRPMPMPDSRHFLFDVPEDDERAFVDSLQEAAEMARVETIKKMLEPLQHLAAKLTVPIGEQGSIFRDSALENVLEGIDVAQRLNMDDDEQLSRTIGELREIAQKCHKHKESLRVSPMFREQQAAKLAKVQSAMEAYMGGGSVEPMKEAA